MSLPRRIRSVSRRTELARKEPPTILKRLSPFEISVPKRTGVVAYIAEHVNLAKLLPKICRQLRQAFGREVELSLELYRDPEIDDTYLTLYVRQEKYDSAIIERIEAVSRQFNDKLEQVSGYLLLTTDFHRPRGNNAV
jgi:hypothetical protein